MQYAPIALFVYNRPDTLQKVIHALQKNVYAQETDLFIFSDGPKVFADDQKKTDSTRQKVDQVRRYIKTVSGFRSVEVFESEGNKGLGNSIVSGVTKVVDQHGKVIVLEDDIYTSEYFLKYMNDALTVYENDERVISIHGYISPLKAKLPETFFFKGADCWGWATWKRGWDLFSRDSEGMYNQIVERNLIREFNIDNTFRYSDTLRDHAIKKKETWAILWYASAFIHDKYTLYPGRSLVQNIGFDNSGVNCKKTEKFSVKLTTSQIFIEKQDPTDCPEYLAALKKFNIKMKPSTLKRILRKFKVHWGHDKA
jgi:hypothetical protein